MTDAIQDDRGRELDARVAEVAMGWRITHRGRRVVDGGGREVGGMRGLADARSWIAMTCPAYTTDPAADLTVLERVRETWESDARGEFAWELYCKWQGRLREVDSAPRATMMYDAGDYSRAALAVLDKQTAHPE